MSIVTNTQWSVNANESTGDLIFNADSLTGTMLGDPIDNVQLTAISLSFVRHGNGFTQFYTGWPALHKVLGNDGQWFLWGMFTHLEGGQMSLPYGWSTDLQWIPG